MSGRFSERQGYTGQAREITVRQEAPPELRKAIPRFARDEGMSPREVRNVVCRQLLADPSELNFVDSYILQEVDGLLSHCEWFRVYDFAELFHAKLRRPPVGRVGTTIATTIAGPLIASNAARAKSKAFENRLNKYFLEHGIGWQMSHGKIVHRGSHAFEEATRRAVEVLGETRQQSAKGEIEEALHDISRRPKPDATGAITHAMAALECVARDATNNPKLTLGQLVPLLNLTQPLDKAVHALWGFSSQRARHIQEGQSVGIAEAELVVFVACALCAFVSGDRK